MTAACRAGRRRRAGTGRESPAPRRSGRAESGSGENSSCAQRAPVKEAPCARPARCSLRVTGVGCPERAQVGPLPWLSKSRPGAPAKSKISWGSLAGVWSAVRTPRSLMLSRWATRTSPAALREPTNTTWPIVEGGRPPLGRGDWRSQIPAHPPAVGPRLSEVPRAASCRPLRARPTSSPTSTASWETR
jgi:hypothetical protein